MFLPLLRIRVEIEIKLGYRKVGKVVFSVHLRMFRLGFELTTFTDPGPWYKESYLRVWFKGVKHTYICQVEC